LSWKPKEKDLTPEEAIALAQKELSPFWAGSLPQIAGVIKEGRPVVVPLSPDFIKKAFLLFLVDPTTFAGETTFEFAREWFQRFNVHELGIFVILLPPYPFWRSAETLRRQVEELGAEFTLILDADDTLGKAFHSGPVPKVLLLDRGKKVFEYEGENWLDNTEIDIHNFLRITDPGLPLSPKYQPRGMVKDLLRFEFGFSPKFDKTVSIPGPGFTKYVEPEKAGQKFSGKSSKKEPPPAELRRGDFQDPLPQAVRSGEVFLRGVWIQDAEKITTKDPEAMVAFTSQGSRVSVVLESAARIASEYGIMTIEVDGNPAYEAISSHLIGMDDQGRSMVEIQNPQVYELLVKLENKPRNIVFRFPKADKIAVSIYGIRFAEDRSKSEPPQGRSLF